MVGRGMSFRDLDAISSGTSNHSDRYFGEISLVFTELTPDPVITLQYYNKILTRISFASGLDPHLDEIPIAMIDLAPQVKKRGTGPIKASTKIATAVKPLN